MNDKQVQLRDVHFAPDKRTRLELGSCGDKANTKVLGLGNSGLSTKLETEIHQFVDMANSAFLVAIFKLSGSHNEEQIYIASLGDLNDLTSRDLSDIAGHWQSYCKLCEQQNKSHIRKRFEIEPFPWE